MVLVLKPDHPYLSGNFAPIQKTVPLTPCLYCGSIPADLAGGQYVRNGGNPVTNDDALRNAHWFDGDGMLGGVLFRRVVGDKGTKIQPEFVNQYLLTDVYAYAKTTRLLRKPFLPSIATLVDPCTSALSILLEVLRAVVLVILSRMPGSPRVVKKISVANTGIVYHDGRALATCESGPPLRVTLPSLQTIGWFDGRRAENEQQCQDVSMGKPGFGGGGMASFMKEWTTAHPRVDPGTGELIAFHSLFVRPYVFYSIVPPAKKPGVSTTEPRFNLPVPGVASPKMMHDFGASKNHTVIMDLPLSLDPFNMAKGVPVMSYDTAGKSRFGVFPRYQPQAVQWFETNPCCIFHTANCWDTVDSRSQATSVSLLACRLTSASLVFSAGNLPTPAFRPVPPEYIEEEQCRLYYYDFLLGKGHSRIRHQWALSAIPFEFPVVSPLHAMSEARYVYGCSTSSSSYSVALGKAAKIDILAKVDVKKLIARGAADPPQSIRGCVDMRSTHDILGTGLMERRHDVIQLFKMPDGWFAQEPRFVPRLNPQSEDDGWLLTYVFDESQLDERGRCRDDAISELWVLDAKNMRTVQARVRLPQRVPYGFHGMWFDEDEIRLQRPFERLREMPSEYGASRTNRGLNSDFSTSTYATVGPISQAHPSSILLN
ncbi:retinal pigment epithelial membrane protein [Diplogelasinospora grovesii]|uniref:Retinal pigment epithelial membrane protein n=1 Tax=Diplogelasinospora grovesii TaxID=303347 RepID=A0AAN6MWB6_9PEZI|nr:retinal pigment epithelial membrane protein [Diplogelasinospora grovesii]